MEHFNEEELRDIIFDLGLDHEAVEGNNKNSLARELVVLAQRHRRLDDLAKICQRRRPDVAWGDL